MPPKKKLKQDTKQDNRAERESAIKELNILAEDVGLSSIAIRSVPAAVSKLYKEVCGKIAAESVGHLLAMRGKYVDHGGGGDLPIELAEKALMSPQMQADTDGIVSAHKKLVQGSSTPFRLHSKAFMLTFNSLSFEGTQESWDKFVSWVQDRAKTVSATAWSCTMEESLGSEDKGREHFHCYFCWHGPGGGIDHRTTDSWVYEGVRPRVDANSEKRGPHEWLKATQHGHFYVSVLKKGTIFTATNYSPWESDWVPEAWWVVNLWREHKLEHDQYMDLSVRLRDGHDRRKANCEVIQAAEIALCHRSEKKFVLEMLTAKQRPFKPLTPAVESWKMHYEDLDDRYQIINHGSLWQKHRVAHLHNAGRRWPCWPLLVAVGHVLAIAVGHVLAIICHE